MNVIKTPGTFEAVLPSYQGHRARARVRPRSKLKDTKFTESLERVLRLAPLFTLIRPCHSPDVNLLLVELLDAQLCHFFLTVSHSRLLPSPHSRALASLNRNFPRQEVLTYKLLEKMKDSSFRFPINLPLFARINYLIFAPRNIAPACPIYITNTAFIEIKNIKRVDAGRGNIE